MNKKSSILPLKLFLVSLLSYGSLIENAFALPQGGNVTGGEASINQINSNQLDINQVSDRAVIDWNSFNVSTPETINFIQPSNNSAILNRVTGDTRSNIAGSINANGQVMLVNPNGIIFTKTANINVGSLFATTLDITNTDFLNNNLNFFSVEGKAPATVENYGNITVEEAGIATFVAPGVVNSGIITARLGKVILSSGERFTLDFYGDGLIAIELDPVTASQIVTADGTPITALVSNSGEIYSDGGLINISAATASELINQTINMDGILFARSVRNENGHIILSGEGGDITVNGKIDASGSNIGETGGFIEIIAEDTLNVLETAFLDGSGYEGGGFVETSGSYINILGLADTSSINGETGTWLIDPVNLTIGGVDDGITGDPDFNTTATDGSAFLSETTLEAALLNSNVTVTTAGGTGGDGDITLDATINSTSGNSLTLTARNFILNSSNTLEIDGDLIFNLNAVNTQTNAPTSSIQNAIDSIGTSVAPNSSTIRLGDGTFSGATLDINKNVTIEAINPAMVTPDMNGVINVIPTVSLDGEDTRQVVDVSSGVEVNFNNIGIIDGSADIIGGGISNRGTGTLNVTNSTLSGNSTVRGGGIYNSGTLNVTNSTLSDNGSSNISSSGGGIYNSGSGTLNVTNSTLSGNYASNGGGISNRGSGTLNVTNSTLSDNSAYRGGGISNSGTVSLTNSTLSGNSANNGGGIINLGTVSLTNSTLSGNSAGNNGGGIFNFFGTVSLTNSTLSGNSAGNNGGGIFNFFGTVSLTNSIIANSLNGGDIVNSATINSSGINIVEDGSFTGANILL